MSEKTGILPTVEQWEAAQKEIERLRAERDQARRNCLREVELLATEQEEHASTRTRAELAEQDAARLAAALKNLNDACWRADIDGDLSGHIDGELLTNADAALAAHEAQKGDEGITTTQYEPYDGDYTDADYTKLLDDIQTEQGIDIGAWLEICATLNDDDQIHINCSNDEGNEWEFDYTFPIPASWDVETVRAMFEGNVYLQTDAYQKPEDAEDETTLEGGEG